MNFTASNKPRTENTFSAAGKGIFLLKTAEVTIPAGLDWVIKRQLTSVIYRQLMGLYCTDQRVDDLFTLDKALGETEQMQAYTVTLYGWEAAVLYGFLLEQEQWYTIWSPEIVPSELRRSVRAGLRGFLPKLHKLVRGVDVQSFRPTSANG